MPSINDMIAWIKGTRLRTYINVLNKQGGGQLIKEIIQRAKKEYDIQKWRNHF